MQQQNGMKRCYICKDTKPVAEFNRSRSKTDGFQDDCRSCRRVANDAARAARGGEVGRLRRARELRGYGVKRCSRCLEVKAFSEFHPNARQKDGLTNNCRPCQIILMRQTRLSKYGLTFESFDALMSAQKGRCAICREPFDAHPKNTHIDHDHACCPGRGSCGKCVRAILCGRCNSGLGLFRDSPANLRAAADYLELPR